MVFLGILKLKRFKPHGVSYPTTSVNSHFRLYIFVDALPQSQKSNSRKAFVANDLQMVERDFAFLTNKDQALGDLIKTITNCDKQLIKEVNIFDIFSGKNIPEDKKSVALRVKTGDRLAQRVES